jgi:hypothetical protein
MKPSLELAQGYVPAAFALPKSFEPENIRFGLYTFVPWVRSGISAALEDPQGLALRATVTASVAVRGANNEKEVAAGKLVLRGPGDVIGLESIQIIRRVPQPDTLDAEENFLAHIEFDRPEMPWLFSPFAPAGDQLRPWLALVVCDQAVSELLPGPPGYPRQLRTRRGELQSPDEAWAWAHAQVLGTVAGGPSVADRLSTSHGPTNLSRILCPRRLQNGRGYIAALVPTFECGVNAARNIPGGDLKWAWDSTNPEGEIVLPAFDAWKFSTAKGGDFEKLAQRLHGVPAPWMVGRRMIDTSKPGAAIGDLPPGAPGRVQVLKCAMVSPTPPPPDAPPDNSAWDAATRDRLRLEVDRVNTSDEELPRVGARLYARFQRGARALGPVFGSPPADTPSADADWFSQLNTSPVHRIVAGLGTRVVQRDQEKLMQAAWAQVGGLRGAKQTLVRMQFARYVGEALQRNHLTKLDLGGLTQTLRGAHAKVRAAGSEKTLHGVIAGSAVAPAAMTATFRRMARMRGPLARFAGVAGLRNLVAAEDRFRDFRRQYVELEGIRTLSTDAIQSFSPEVIGRLLGVAPETAPAALAERLASRRSPSIADSLARPLNEWRIPAGSLDLGARAARLVDERVTAALPAEIAAAPARSEALAPLLTGMGNSAVTELSDRANAVVGRIHERLTFSATPRIAGLPTRIGAIAPFRLAPHLAVRTSVVTAPDPQLRFETATSRTLTSAVVRVREVAFTDLARAVSQTILGSGFYALPPTPERPTLALTREALLNAVSPAASMTEYARARFKKVQTMIAPDWWSDGRVAPIMAAPRFDRAMFDALDEYDRDWLIPGLGEIEFTDFVTILATNPVFTETFLIGLSDEMGRELLWRGYPTDQRGTYFYRFWNGNADDLKTQIHRFEHTPLGSHLADSSSAEGCIVLVVHGELVRRHPEVICVAMRAGGFDAQGHPQFTADMKDVAPSLFQRHLRPDIHIAGFKLGLSQIRTEPWWFLITENPSGPRFGLDIPENDAVAVDHVARNDLDWNDLGPLRSGHFLSPGARTLIVKDKDSDPPETMWPGNSAIIARTLLQNPVRAAFDAKKLIAPVMPSE